MKKYGDTRPDFNVKSPKRRMRWDRQTWRKDVFHGGGGVGAGDDAGDDAGRVEGEAIGDWWWR